MLKEFLIDVSFTRSATIQLKTRHEYWKMMQKTHKWFTNMSSAYLWQQIEICWRKHVLMHRDCSLVCWENEKLGFRSCRNMVLPSVSNGIHEKKRASGNEVEQISMKCCSFYRRKSSISNEQYRMHAIILNSSRRLSMTMLELWFFPSLRIDSINLKSIYGTLQADLPREVCTPTGIFAFLMLA